MVFALIKLSFRLNYDKNQIEFTRHQAQVRIPLKLGWFHLAPTQNELTTMNCFRDRSTQQPQQSCQMKQNGVSRVEQVSRSSIPTNIFCVLLQTRISSSHSSFKYINYIFPNPRFTYAYTGSMWFAHAKLYLIQPYFIYRLTSLELETIFTNLA